MLRKISKKVTYQCYLCDNLTLQKTRKVWRSNSYTAPCIQPSCGCGPSQAPGNAWSQAGSRHTAAMAVDPGRLQAMHGPRQAPGIQQLWLWTQAGSRQHMVPGRLQAYSSYGCGPRQAPGNIWSQAGSRHTAAMTVDPGRLQATHGPRQAPGNAARCLGPWSQAGSRHIYSSGCGPRQAPGNAARCLGPWSQAGSRHCSNAYIRPWFQAGSRQAPDMVQACIYITNLCPIFLSPCLDLDKSRQAPGSGPRHGNSPICSHGSRQAPGRLF